MATAITPEAILQEDGAEAVLAEFMIEVRAGEETLRRVLAEAEAGAKWTFRTLREAAEDAAPQLRSTAISVALMGLENSGALQADYASSTVAAAA